MAEYEWNIPWSRKVRSGDSEYIQNDGLQGDTTPMASNLKLLCDASLETVDAMMYR